MSDLSILFQVRLDELVNNKYYRNLPVQSLMFNLVIKHLIVLY